jgi:hypothetical protein
VLDAAVLGEKATSRRGEPLVEALLLGAVDAVALAAAAITTNTVVH